MDDKIFHECHVWCSFVRRPYCKTGYRDSNLHMITSNNQGNCMDGFLPTCLASLLCREKTKSVHTRHECWDALAWPLSEGIYLSPLQLFHRMYQTLVCISVILIGYPRISPSLFLMPGVTERVPSLKEISIQSPVGTKMSVANAANMPRT